MGNEDGFDSCFTNELDDDDDDNDVVVFFLRVFPSLLTDFIAPLPPAFCSCTPIEL